MKGNGAVQQRVKEGRRDRSGLLGFFLLLCVLLLSSDLAPKAVGQATDSVAWRIGALLQGGLATYSEPLEIYDGFAGCGTFSEQLSPRLGATFFFERPVDIGTAMSVDIVAGLRFEDRSLSFSDARNAAGRTETGQQVTIATEHRLEANLYRIALAIGAVATPIGPIRVGVSPSIGLHVPGETRQYERITGPLGATFTGTDDDEREIARGGELHFSPVIAALSGSLGVRIPVGEDIALESRIGLDIDLTSILQGRSWRTTSGGIGIGVVRSQRSISLPKPVMPRPNVTEPATPPAPVIPEVIAEVPYLEARIAAWGVDDDGRRYADPVIEIREAPYMASLPLLPHIFFAFEEAEIPERYLLFSTRQEADRFDVDSLVDVTPELLHRHLPNVIGARMRARPEVSLRIRGTLSGDEESAATRSPLQTLARSRAESLRRYLVDIWEIDPRRLPVTTGAPTDRSSEERAEGRAENRRAELHFDGESLARPVVIERLARIASPPAIVFDKSVVADTAVERMVVTVEQGEKVLLRFEEGRVATDPAEQTWPLADMRIRRDLTPIFYRFAVTDVTGQTVTDEGSFRVLEQVTRDEPAEIEVAEYLLAGFPYNRAELSSEHVAAIFEIARNLEENDLIEVTGFTDRVGDEERNRELAGNRAANVAASLADAQRERGVDPSASDITVRASTTASVENFDNGLPEGRIFSRMVRVTILRGARE